MTAMSISQDSAAVDSVRAEADDAEEEESSGTSGTKPGAFASFRWLMVRFALVL